MIKAGDMVTVKGGAFAGWRAMVEEAGAFGISLRVGDWVCRWLASGDVEPCRGWVAYTEDRPPRVGDVVRWKGEVWKLHRNSFSDPYVGTMLPLEHSNGRGWAPTTPINECRRWTGCPAPHCTREGPHDTAGCVQSADAPKIDPGATSTEQSGIPVRSADGSIVGIAQRTGRIADVIRSPAHIALTAPPDVGRLARALFRVRMLAEAARAADTSVMAWEWKPRLQYEGRPTQTAEIVVGYQTAHDADQRIARVLDVMWNKTKLDVRAECEQQAQHIVAAWAEVMR